MNKKQNKKSKKTKDETPKIIDSQSLAPIKEGSKFTIPKTWLSEKQIMWMVQKTPSKYVFTKPAKGGGTWDYVAGFYVINEKLME